MAQIALNQDQMNHVARHYPDQDEWMATAGQREYKDGVLTVPDSMEAVINGMDLTKPPASALYDHAAAVRWAKETSGCTVTGFGPVPSDERTQSVITAAYLKAVTDPNYSIASWKAGPNTYMPLSNAQIIAIADAMEEHIQGCFEANEKIDSQIADDTIVSFEAIDNHADWP